MMRTVVLPEASFSWTFCPVLTHGVVRGYAIDMTSVHKTQQALQLSADQLRQSNRRLDQALDEAKGIGTRQDGISCDRQS